MVTGVLVVWDVHPTVVKLTLGEPLSGCEVDKVGTSETVELDVVARSVVEVRTDTGTVGVEVMALSGSSSIHTVVEAVGTMVTDMDSGQGVVEKMLVKGVVVVFVRLELRNVSMLVVLEVTRLLGEMLLAGMLVVVMGGEELW